MEIFKIKAKLEVTNGENHKLYIQILEMPEKWRGCGELFVYGDGDEFSIYSYGHPEMDNNTFYLRGNEENLDNEICFVSFNNFYSYFSYVSSLFRAICEFTGDKDMSFPIVASDWVELSWKLNIRPRSAKRHPLTEIFR